MATAENTLLVKHLPEELSVSEKIELLKHFGASNVRCMSSTGPLCHCAFVTFANKNEASSALSRLHQLDLLGRRLVAVFANQKHESEGLLPHLAHSTRGKIAVSKDEKAVDVQDQLQSKADDFHKWLQGILPNLGLGFPRCPILHYKYPPPSQTILNNICNALVAVPKFYTQVLHLMNAMNLPPPFGPPTLAPPLSPDQPMEEQNEEEEMQFSSTAESEMESDNENKTHLPLKRPQKARKKKKTSVKRPRLLPPPQIVVPSAPAIDPSSVFETGSVDAISKKISFNIRPTEDVTAPAEEAQVEAGGFGMLERPLVSSLPEEGDGEGLEVKWKDAKFVTRHEMEKNRISSREMKGMSVFKGYQAGEATCRLYVKNLAKQVNETDLFNVYGRYINRASEQERAMFDVRLMKEGRMKGQAFVTLASQIQARDALKDTNGYLLHGKPIVVQFARSAKPKEQGSKGNAS